MRIFGLIIISLALGACSSSNSDWEPRYTIPDITVIERNGVQTAEVNGCPNWNKPYGTDESNSFSSNFGCASQMNLAEMLVNKRDAIEGQEMKPSDSSLAIRSIQNYQTGEMPDLMRDDVETGSSN
jgi:hypothetical protein